MTRFVNLQKKTFLPAQNCKCTVTPTHSYWRFLFYVKTQKSKNIFDFFLKKKDQHCWKYLLMAQLENDLRKNVIHLAHVYKEIIILFFKNIIFL